MIHCETKGLNTRRRLVLALYMLVVAGYVAAVATLFFNVTLAVVLVNLLTLFYIVVVRRLDKAYSGAFVRASLQNACTMLEGCAVLEKADARRVPADFGTLLPLGEKGRAHFTVAVEGLYRGEKVVFGEVNAWYPLQTPVKKRKIAVESGLFFALDLQGPTGLDLLFQKGEGLEEGMGLNNTTLVWQGEGGKVMALDDTEQNRAAAASFARRAQHFAKKAGSHEVLLRLKGGELYAFVANRTLVHKIPVLSSVTNDDLQINFVPELAPLLELQKQYGGK